MDGKLLVVDDDAELCFLLRELLEQSGYSVEFESDGNRGIERIQAQAYDLLILDGFEVLKRVRERSHVPVLMLSAKSDRYTRVFGLRAGADDFLTKPFDPEELLARIQAILRRATTTAKSTNSAPDEIKIAELRFVPASRDVYFQDKRLDLTAMEIEILECLMRSVGKPVSRDHLSLRLYNRVSAPFDRAIDTHVSRIRRKMGDGRGMILSVRGTGYQIRYPSDSQK